MVRFSTAEPADGARLAMNLFVQTLDVKLTGVAVSVVDCPRLIDVELAPSVTDGYGRASLSGVEDGRSVNPEGNVGVREPLSIFVRLLTLETMRAS